jgi:hypothetical protein
LEFPEIEMRVDERKIERPRSEAANKRISVKRNKPQIPGNIDLVLTTVAVANMNGLLGVLPRPQREFAKEIAGLNFGLS